MYLTNYCIGITAFWFTKTEGLRRAFLTLRDLSAGMLIPLTFFPKGMQKVLFYLPFQFITYVPTRVFIGHYELAGIESFHPPSGRVAVRRDFGDVCGRPTSLVFRD